MYRQALRASGVTRCVFRIPSTIVLLTAAVWAPSAARADLFMIEATQVGGFYDGGAAPDNSPAFQNYFVGYGTTPGFPRTPERRSFFWFDLSGVEGDIIAATVTLKLPFGGLIYGKGPGDPELGPVPSDTTETFRLGFTLFDETIVTSPGLPPATVDTIFESFKTTSDATPIAVPLTFMSGGPPPPPDGLFDIPFTPAGLTLLEFYSGMDIVLTGWMPTWTEDVREVPDSDPPELLEADELIFGLTDVHLGSFPVPVLTIMTAPVPEATGLLMVAAVGGAVAAGVKVRRRFFL